jgi:hypothetical protein
VEVLIRQVRFVLALLAVALGPATGVVRAQAQDPLELEVRAVYLYNFARFVEWPPSSFPDASAPIRICIFGADPFGAALDRVLANETVGGRPLRAVRLTVRDDLLACHVVYVGAVGRSRTVAALDHFSGHPIITVGEDPSFLAEGGTIRFKREGKRVRFDVNLRAAERSGLRVSSRLLSVAADVRRDLTP